MADNLFRRGGTWWARLVVPARHRDALDRREFIQSCRTHEKAIAKLVAAVLLAGWRRQLLRLESTRMTADVLKIVDGAPGLAGGGALPLIEAVQLSGVSQDQLLRSAADGALRLFCRVSQVAGHFVPLDHLEPISPGAGRAGGVVVPQPQQLPPSASEATQSGLLSLSDSADVAGAVLADGLATVTIVACAVPGQPGVIFVPDTPTTVEVGKLEVLAVEVDALRLVMKQKVSQDAVDHARALQRAVVQGVAAPVGKWAEKPLSEAIKAYCTRPDGLAQTLASEHERRQRMASMLLLTEFHGDLSLSEISVDTLREFRERMREIPDHANRLKAAERGASMTETIAILRTKRPGYKRMTDAQVDERVQWLVRLFAWLRKNDYIGADPALVLRGESGLTRAERIALERGDEEPGRRPFTDDELRVLFSQVHYQTGNGVHVTRRNERWRPFEYWAPLIALFAGLRLGEVAQLHLDDVVQIDGQWCFDVNRRTADKSLKTSASARLVPMHERLVQLGLATYCERLRAMGFRRMFPELRYASGPARYGRELGRVMTRTLRGLGLPPDVTFHSLRHCCNGALQRAAGEWPDPMLRTFVRYKIIGHELPDDVNLAHYSSTTVAEMARLVNGAVFALSEVGAFDLEHAVWRLGLYLPGGAADEDMGPAA